MNHWGVEMSEESAIKKFGWEAYIGKDQGTRVGEPVTAMTCPPKTGPVVMLDW